MKKKLDLCPAQQGFSDDKLESLSQAKSFFEAGYAPWVSWESENSSFGKTLRAWAYFPNWLPIFINSDHGVHWGATCWPNEVDSAQRVFFSWNKKKSDLMNKKHDKKAYYITHPWVAYRKEFFSNLQVDRRGTIIFWAHSNTTTEPVYRDIENYMKSLNALPEDYHPIVLCLSFHDIKKGLHHKLRKYNLPIVTAGTTNSQSFVDRFYSLVSQFKFSSSSNIGSHTFYLLEAGIPFFLYGTAPEYYISGSKSVDDGKQKLSDYGDEEDQEKLAILKELLSVRVSSVTAEQREIVSEYLGMKSNMTRRKASWIMWREFFLNIHRLPALYYRKLVRIKR